MVLAGLGRLLCALGPRCSSIHFNRLCLVRKIMGVRKTWKKVGIPERKGEKVKTAGKDCPFGFLRDYALPKTAAVYISICCER